MFESRDLLIIPNTQSRTPRLGNITRSSEESFTADFCNLSRCFCLNDNRQREKVIFVVEKERYQLHPTLLIQVISKVLCSR